MVIFHADHPDLPLTARIWLSPDPIHWPDAATEDNPILLTTSEEAETITG